MKKINIVKIIFIFLIFIIVAFGANYELETGKNNVDGEEEQMKNEENLDGKGIALLGDSLIAGYGNDNGGLDFYLKQNLPNTEIENYSVSGSTITENTGENEIVIKNQIKNIKGNPDIIIFNGGVNDCIGYSIGFLNSDLRKPIGTSENVENDTVWYDFEDTVSEMKNKFPKAKIFYIQMCQLDGPCISELVKTDEQIGEIIERKDVFFDEIKKVCEKNDISYIDVSKYFEGNGLKYKQDDWLHINDDGYNAIIDDIIEQVIADWRAKFIRVSDSREDLWTCFRKDFEVSAGNLNKVIAKISVDSQYWLYINGQEVVKQGGVKRGEKPNAIFYDSIDITDYIKEGQNTIAVLAWYWGDTALSYVPSSTPGFLFQAQVGDIKVISDSTWKAKIHPAYLHSGDIPNYRLAEYNEYYNANVEMLEWYMPEFDDSEWENATVVCNAGELPFGKLIKRDIPLFKNCGFKEYENMGDYRDYVTTADGKIEMVIPYNAQFTPYLKIEAPSNLRITIKTDQFADVNGDALYTTYITKEGIQEYEARSWINGEKVYYEIPAGVKIISLGYYETGYDTEIVGSFSCEDEFLNKLWEMSARTLYVNMRDTYMDCPTRERACWFGDASIDMLEAMYSLDTNAYDLYEKCATTLGNWNKVDLLFTVLPNTRQDVHIPIQMLLGINSMYEYYEYTGNEEFIREMYEPVKKYLNLYYLNDETGFIELSQGHAVWEWGDSAEGVDYKLQRSMWYYLALSKFEKIAKIVGNEEDIADTNEKLLKIEEMLNSYWTEKGYMTSNVSVPDERANAVAVISGLADSSKYEAISKIFRENYQASSFMEKYVLEAMCLMGDIDSSQERIKNRYSEMVDGEKACSTLWENWNYDAGTKNHAWSGGPLIIMSKFFAGIEPQGIGYEIVRIKPEFGKLNNLSANVETVKGMVSMKATKTSSEIILDVFSPTKTLVAVEKMNENPTILINDETIYQNCNMNNTKNIEFEKEDEKYLYFFLEKGEYNIISR